MDLSMQPHVYTNGMYSHLEHESTQWNHQCRYALPSPSDYVATGADHNNLK